MSDIATIGLIGKHPGYGDFLRWGLSDAVADAMTQWRDAVLPPLRDEMGEDWGAFWDAAQTLRFWIGRAVWGRTIVGVLRPSRDRVGRRYPLIFMAEHADVAAPLGDVDQSPWEGIEAHMDKMQAGQGAMALMEGLSLELPRETAQHAALGPTLWAHHPEAKLDALLRSAEAVDRDRAQLSRSYWWSPGSDAQSATWLGCPGLPEAPAMGWLLSGVRREVPA
jgi:type VI secretion system protein ImpM